MKYALLILPLLAGCSYAVFDKPELEAIIEACVKSNGSVTTNQLSNRTRSVTCTAQFYGEQKK